MENREAIAKILTDTLVDQGKIIEAGFSSLRHMAIAANASQQQIYDMRMSFFAGAAHLFGSIMTMLDPGDDATESDFTRMNLIRQELERFQAEFEAAIKTKGTA